MDTSNLVCNYHKHKEAMGVCSSCGMKLCLECYFLTKDNKCYNCAKVKVVKKVEPKENTIKKESSTEYKRNIIKIILEMVFGLLIGYFIIGFFFRRGYSMVLCLSLIPTFHFVTRIDKAVFGTPEHKGLAACKVFIKIVISLFLSATLIGFILSLFELYYNFSMLAKESGTHKPATINKSAYDELTTKFKNIK